MSTILTIRDIDPKDKAWLKREDRSSGISIEELVRRLIHEKRTKREPRTKPSEIFAQYFGEEHGFEVPLSKNYGYRPISFPDDDHK